MITSVNRSLAEQIVNTIKDVCNHDINFIDCSGIILASTNPARIGTFHEIGLKAAQTGTSIEVTEDDSFSGTQKGINMPLYHEDVFLLLSELPVFLIKFGNMPISPNGLPIF